MSTSTRTRRELILQLVSVDGRVTSAGLAARFGVTDITIRRDLRALGEAGLLTRVHGGATRRGEEPPRDARLVVGIVVPSSSYYFSELIRGAEEAARRLNVQLILAVTGSDREVVRTCIRRLVDIGAEGILITPPDGDADPERACEYLSGIPVPVVLMERSFGLPHLADPVPHVRTDHEYGAMLALRHLHLLGHESIGIALCPTPTAYWLEKGINSSARHFGINVEGGAPVWLSETSRAAMEHTLAAFLHRCIQSGSSAIFIHNDLHATQLLHLALARGLEVPRDLALVTYDDVVASRSTVRLTAVSPPRREVGSSALDMMANRLSAHPHYDKAVRQLVLLPQILVRDSCGGSRPLDA